MKLLLKFLVLFSLSGINIYCFSASDELVQITDTSNLETECTNFITAADASLKEMIDTHIFAINVGQGNCFLQVEKSADGSTKEITIVDAGTCKNEPAFESSLKEELTEDDFEGFLSEDCNKRKRLLEVIFKDATLKTVIITHPHTDHYNLIHHLLKFARDKCQNFSFLPNWKTIIGGEEGKLNSSHLTVKSVQELESDSCQQIYLYDNTKEKVEERLYKLNGSSFITGGKVNEVFANAKITFFERTGKSEGNNPNSRSLILSLNKMVYTGDADGQTFEQGDEDSFVSKINPPVHGLAAPHHCSKTEQSGKRTRTLLTKLKPLFVIICVGSESQHRHPNVREVFNLETNTDVSKPETWNEWHSFLAEVDLHEIIITGRKTQDPKSDGEVDKVPVAIYEAGVPQSVAAQCFRIDHDGKVEVYDHDNTKNWLPLRQQQSQ